MMVNNQIMRLIRLLIATLAALNITSCEEAEKYVSCLEITNSADEQIEITTWQTLDETILKPSIFEAEYFPELIKIEPHQTILLNHIGSSYVKKDSEGSFQVMVFKESTLRDHTIEEIVQNDICDGVFVFKFDDAQIIDKSKNDGRAKFILIYGD